MVAKSNGYEPGRTTGWQYPLLDGVCVYWKRLFWNGDHLNPEIQHAGMKSYSICRSNIIGGNERGAKFALHHD